MHINKADIYISLLFLYITTVQDFVPQWPNPLQLFQMIMKPLPSVFVLFSPCVSCSHGKALVNKVLCRDMTEASINLILKTLSLAFFTAAGMLTVLSIPDFVYFESFEQSSLEQWHLGFWEYFPPMWFITCKAYFEFLESVVEAGGSLQFGVLLLFYTRERSRDSVFTSIVTDHNTGFSFICCLNYNLSTWFICLVIIFFTETSNQLQ